MQEVANRQAGYQVFKGQDGGTSIQGVWATTHPFLDPQAVRAGIRDQVKARLEQKVPADLTERRNKARRLIGEIRADLNMAAQARAEAGRRLTDLWGDLASLAEIQAAEVEAEKADARIGAIQNRLRFAEEKLAAISEELRAILDLAVTEIAAEAAPVTEAHLAAEQAIQRAMDKFASALAESACIRFLWWSSTQRNDGGRDGFADLARLVLADFQHEPAGADQVDADQVEAVAVVAE